MKSEIFGQNKIFSHIDKIHNWLQRKRKTVITLEIDPTNTCNHACPGCAGGRIGRKSLTAKEMASYISQAKNLGIRGIIATGGGEPLLNKNTPNILEYTNSLGLDVGLITNGTTLTKDISKTILENCTWCRISLDAGTPEMYKATHGMLNKTFYKTLENIKELSDLKKKTKSKCTIGTAYLTGKNTLEGMVDFAKVSKKLGVDYAQFRPFHGDRTSISPELAQAKKLETKDFKILHSKQKYEHFLEENLRPYRKCYGANFTSVIQSDSSMPICCHMRGHPKYYLGNLKEKSMKEILNPKNIERVVNKIDFKDCISYCRNDSFNRILWDIKQNKQHVNFL